LTQRDIIAYRLINQQIAGTGLSNPAALVDWFGAMQAQELPMVQWAIGLRLPHVRITDIEEAFNRGDILRTHLLRPTWHFVTPGDIRWLLELTAPRVHALNAYWYRKFELDGDIFRQSKDIFARILRDGNVQPRSVLKSGLEDAGIMADGLRLSYIMMQAELDGLICSGPRVGRQFTYALLEERVPLKAKLTREEALATLALKYFTSRSPATLKDFAYWSGLTMKDAKDGAAMLPSPFISEKIGDETYVIHPFPLEKQSPGPVTFLMPDYDEYGMSYKDRSIYAEGTPPVRYEHAMVVEGMRGGSWKRSVKNNKLEITLDPYPYLTEEQKESVVSAGKKYLEFFFGSNE